MASANKPVRIQFNTGRIIKRERRAMGMAFNAAVAKMQKRVRDKIGTPYPPASRPGAHPHRRTGRLQSSFRVLRKGYSIFVRMPLYGAYLEGGTSRMKARPFVRRNIHDKGKFWTKWINNEIRRRVGEPIKK